MALMGLSWPIAVLFHCGILNFLKRDDCSSESEAETMASCTIEFEADASSCGLDLPRIVPLGEASGRGLGVGKAAPPRICTEKPRLSAGPFLRLIPEDSLGLCRVCDFSRPE
jgi:hypothetical protein